MSKEPPDFPRPPANPLPRSPEFLALERKSRAALEALLPADRLVINDIRHDFGADFSLEVHQDGYATNCTATVQLKAVTEPDILQDGSVSLSVQVSNLNYLLNSASPMYILYVESLDEFRYCWARDEAHRLTQANPPWREQETVALHLTDRLDPKSIDAICGKILDFTATSRRIAEIHAALAASGAFRVEIDPAKREVRGPEEAAQLIREVGMPLVASGQEDIVIRAGKLLSKPHDAEPTIQLALGYAHLTCEEYLQADAHFAKARLREGELDPSDRRFLALLQVTCDYGTGRIDRKRYESLLEEWTRSAEGETGVLYQLILTRTKLLNARHFSERVPIFARIEQLRREADALPARYEGVRLRAMLLFQEAESIRLLESFIRMMLQAGVPGGLGDYLRNGMDLRELAKLWLEQFAGWETRMNKVVDAIASTGHVRLYCEARLARASERNQLLTSVEQLRRGWYENRGGFPDAPRPTRTDVDAVIEIATRRNYDDILMHAKLVLATSLALEGRKEEAREIARPILAASRALRQPDLERIAALHCTEEGYVDTLVRSLKEKVGGDQDLRLSKTSDDELRLEASDGLVTLHLPEDRFPNLLDDYDAIRAAARERVSWCRHLELLQDLRDTARLGTFYASRPDRVVTCKKLGHQSRFPSPDWPAVLQAFKATYCEGCPDRDPKAPRG